MLKVLHKVLGLISGKGGDRKAMMSCKAMPILSLYLYKVVELIVLIRARKRNLVIEEKKQ